jgi:hypothetical protein
LADPRNTKSIRALVTHAYLQLAHAAWNQNRSRSASLAKYGNYEVRLVERLPQANNESAVLWIELHDVGGRSSMESFGCDDLEAALLAADQVISKAKTLAEEKARTRK